MTAVLARVHRTTAAENDDLDLDPALARPPRDRRWTPAGGLAAGPVGNPGSLSPGDFHVLFL